MKHITFILALFLALAVQAGAQEIRGVQLELFVSNDNGREQLLTVGAIEGASSGLDLQLGESELPPQPPNEIFDARCVSTPGASQLGTGSLIDFRAPATSGNTFSMKYTVAYQAGLNAQTVKLSWAEMLPGRITRLLVDDVDMAGKMEVESQFATGQFIVEVFFDMTPLGFSAAPNPVTFSVNNRDALPSINLVITPQGDSKALWTLDKGDLDWIDLEPSYGEGQMTVVVSVNTRQLSAGNYNGLIQVRSIFDPARLDIPVTMTMAVGIADVPQPTAISMSQNYPNPFNPTTTMEINLGDVQADASPRLVIHDMLGREVADLSSELRAIPGNQTVTFNAAAIPGGVYTCTLQYASAAVTRSMIVLK